MLAGDPRRLRHTRLSRRAHLACPAPAKEIDEVLQPPESRLPRRPALPRTPHFGAVAGRPRPNLEISRLTPDPSAISSGAQRRG